MLRTIIQQLDSVLVAYSGGVDSSVLSFYARKLLKEKARIVISVSPSLADCELSFALEQAQQFAWNLTTISTAEIEDPAYQQNDERRCYYCKKNLFQDLRRLAQEWNIANVAHGANIDDLSDFRPGQQAADEYMVISPLQQSGLTKKEIRHIARHVGLPSWNKPQNACLS